MMMGFGFLGSMLVLALFIVLLLVMIGWKPNNNQVNKKPKPTSETTMEILTKRYASGEIDKDEFDQIKKDL